MRSSHMRGLAAITSVAAIAGMNAEEAYAGNIFNKEVQMESVSPLKKAGAEKAVFIRESTSTSEGGQPPSELFQKCGDAALNGFTTSYNYSSRTAVSSSGKIRSVKTTFNSSMELNKPNVPTVNSDAATCTGSTSVSYQGWAGKSFNNRKNITPNYFFENHYGVRFDQTAKSSLTGFCRQSRGNRKYKLGEEVTIAYREGNSERSRTYNIPTERKLSCR
jgi:hypothetical protein